MLCFSIPVQWAELLNQFNHILTILIHKACFAQTLLGYSVAESKLHVELCHMVPIFFRDIYACHLAVSSVRSQMFWLSSWLEPSFTSTVNSKQLTQDLCLDFSIWPVVRGFLRCWTVSWWILKVLLVVSIWTWQLLCWRKDYVLHVYHTIGNQANKHGY